MIIVMMTANGCAALLLGGGGAAGYFVAKDKIKDEKTVVVIEDRRQPIVSDDELEERLTALYKGDKIINGVYIYVDSDDGTITIYGRVPKKSIETRAIVLAEGINGVKHIISKIRVE